jgi:hypothetical protein
MIILVENDACIFTKDKGRETYEKREVKFLGNTIEANGREILREGRVLDCMHHICYT